MMDNRKAEYEIEQLKRKLSQTIEERDRAMSNCHELWKRLQNLISLASASTGSFSISSGLPTSPSDSYDSANSRSKSTSPNSSAASINDSLLSSTTTTTNQNSNHNNNNNVAANNNSNSVSTNNSNSSQHTSTNSTKQNLQNGSTQIIPINLKRPIEAISSHLNNIHHHHHHHHNNNNHHLHNHSTTNSIHNIANNLHNLNSTNNSSNSSIKLETTTKSPLKNATLLPDKNNNHPLIVEVPKELNQTVGEIVEIAPGQFKCRYCEKTFDRIFSVHRHERVHTGYKPCKCNECGRGFSEKRNLRHHIIRFHSDGSGRELLKRNRNKVASSARQQQFLQSNGNMNNNHHHHSQITANNATTPVITDYHRQLCSQLTSLKGELLDTSGLSVLGAAAAVITVNSSSSRRRKSKPSKKIITNS